MSTLRYLGAAHETEAATPCGSDAHRSTAPRLAGLCEAAQAIRIGDAHAGTEAVIAFIQAFPATETALARLTRRLDEIRARSASRIAVRIENVEIDGRIALLARNDSSTVPAGFSVTAVELTPADGAPVHENLVGAAATEAHVALACRGAGLAETPLSIAVNAPAHLDAATVTVYLRSDAGNRWCVRSAQALPVARTARTLGSRRYDVEARLTGTRRRFVQRPDASVDEIALSLQDLEKRVRGIKIVGAKGVGKTALAREITARPLEVDGTLENIFVTATLDRDANATFLLYDLLQALAAALAARAAESGPETSAPADPGSGAASVPAHATNAAGALGIIREKIAALEQALQTAAEPSLATLNPFLRRNLTSALAALRDHGFAATFAVDEAQELARSAEDELDALRGIVAGTGGVCAWLFVGTGDLVDIDRRARERDSAFGRLMQAATVSVSHFPPADRTSIIEAMLNDPAVLGAEDRSLRFTQGTIAYLAEYTGGHARSALKIANAVLLAARRGPGSASPFACEAKRFVYAADIQWVLAGGGVRAEDEIAYDSVVGDFYEIEQRSGVEMALRALLKLEDDGVRAAALTEVVAAARALDDEDAADADGLAATIERGMRTLASRGFVDRQTVDRPGGGKEERYSFASVMSERFARFGYQSVIAARLAEMAVNGRVSTETRAQEADLRDEGLRQLYEEALEKAEQTSRALQQVREDYIREQTRAEMEREARERAEERARAERARADRPQTVVVNPQLASGDLNVAPGEGATAGGEHVHGNQTNVSIGSINITHTYQQLQQVNATVAAALAGGSGAALPADPGELAAQLPWPDDYRFRYAAQRALAAEARDEAAVPAEEQEGPAAPAERDAFLAFTAAPRAAAPDMAREREQRAADAGPQATGPKEPRAPRELPVQERADALYAQELAQAGELLLGRDAAGLRSWLDQAGNRRILAQVGITWCGASDPTSNQLFVQALTSDDDELLRICRSVCVAAMIYGLLSAAAFENYSPVATLITQELEHLWKGLLLDALASNPIAGRMLVNCDASGNFTGRVGVPLALWMRTTPDAHEVANAFELGVFMRWGSQGPYRRGTNPWDNVFPRPLPQDRAYRLGPAYTTVAQDTLRALDPAGPDHADATFAAYQSLRFDDDRRDGTPLVNNLDILAQALAAAAADDAEPSSAALRSAYRRIARYFTGLACVRSLRNHASHGTRDRMRSAFDERGAKLLFAITAADTASDTCPPIGFCTVWRPGRDQTAWSTIEPMASTVSRYTSGPAAPRVPGNTFEVDPINAGLLLETAQLVRELSPRTAAAER